MELRRKVSLNARDELGDKIDKLTVMMGRLAARDRNEKDNLSLKYIKVEVLTLTIRMEITIRETIKIGVD